MSDPRDEPESPVAAPVAAPIDDAASDSSDRDTDTFEDAPDTASTERSLTNRKPSFSASRLSKSSIAPAADAGKSELEQAFSKLRRNRTASSARTATTGDNRISISNNEAVKPIETPEPEPVADIRDTEPEDAELSSTTTATGHTAASSPITETESNSFTTSHRPKSTDTEEFNLVNNADLDNVNLDDETPAVPAKDTAAKDTVTITATASSPIVETEAPPPPPEKEAPSKTLSLSSFTSVIPSIPWSPSNTSDSSAKPLPVSPSPPPPGTQPSRKLTSPFSWLSRGSTKESAVTSPPLPQASPPIASTRRNTASSVATLTSNPEMMLSKLEEESSRQNGTGRASLKDRFKMIRLREEAGAAGVAGEEDGKTVDGSSSPKLTVGLGIPVPTAGDDQIPTSPMPSSPNPSLAPGTVSGVTAGPSSLSDANVDWDLWQNVMQEGPAAVARSSPEELNKAIATGIPSAIRGVIWQVLAQSKNEELEAVYHDLLARGTEREKERRTSTTVVKETASSSASSVHSGDSVSAASASNVSIPNGSAATPAESIIQRKKKEKDDLAALQKLEKVIRRDLGTRTSYSKFAAAQGLQDGLFGVCKAYALFDEAVGYAQGMNFIIMPILFNMPEEEAFCLLVRLMNQYKLRDLFIQDMPGLHMHLYIFERLLEDLEPALYCHLHRRGISPHLYATQWFLTLFAYRFPLQLVLRIYDLILSEGLTAILKFGIVLMQKNATTLLGMSDMSQLTTYLKDRLFDVYIDASPSAGSILENGFFGSSSSSLDKEVYRADQFVRDACEVKLTPELVKLYTTEWQEKTRAEKERETELETLRDRKSVV